VLFHLSIDCYTDDMQIIGHRGAAGLAPENTLPAIQKALDLKVDWIEFDVHATRDGQLVVIHDKHTHRIADQKLRIKHTDLLTLQQLETDSGVRIPTFAEVVQLAGDRVKINIEIKSHGCAEEVVATIKRLINADYSYDHFLVSSFKPLLLHEIRRRDKNIPLGLLHGVLPLGFLAATKDLHIKAAGFSMYHITPQIVRMAKKRGLFVYVYTVNSVSTAERLESWGVDGIVTNHPERMITAFREPPKL
jgi:glycerophosphoryl diester phosphodiesterase